MATWKKSASTRPRSVKRAPRPVLADRPPGDPYFELCRWTMFCRLWDGMEDFNGIG